MEELKRLYANQHDPNEWKDPEFKATSEGQGRIFLSFLQHYAFVYVKDVKQYILVIGDWRGQLKHIHAHLIEECKQDLALRKNLGEPKLGKVRLVFSLTHTVWFTQVYIVNHVFVHVSGDRSNVRRG